MQSRAWGHRGAAWAALRGLKAPRDTLSPIYRKTHKPFRRRKERRNRWAGEQNRRMKEVTEVQRTRCPPCVLYTTGEVNRRTSNILVFFFNTKEPMNASPLSRILYWHTECATSGGWHNGRGKVTTIIGYRIAPGKSRCPLREYCRFRQKESRLFSNVM